MYAKYNESVSAKLCEVVEGSGLLPYRKSYRKLSSLKLGFFDNVNFPK